MAPAQLLVEDLMMQKYGFSMTDKGTTAVPSDVGGFYLASEVDARIAELEKALKAYFTFSEELSRLIDDDKDVRALKLAMAMAGHRPKYRSDVDEARNALMER